MKTPILQRSSQLAAIVWFVAAAALLIASLSSDSNGYSPGLLRELYFCGVVLLSPVTLILFGWDKWRAKREGSRIPENTLHTLALMGGWPGSVLGQTLFRHKTVKPGFRFVLSLIIAFHVIVVAVVLIQDMRAE